MSGRSTASGPLQARTAWVGLGGNVGDVATAFDAALRRLGESAGVEVLARSRCYRTPAWGLIDQADFVNAVAALRTTLAPRALLELLQAIEREHGRDRSREQRWGPRTLDLDLLAVDGVVLDTSALQLPHPRLAERAFVLVPWAEIAPEVVVPGLGRVADLRDAVDRSGIEAIP